MTDKKDMSPLSLGVALLPRLAAVDGPSALAGTETPEAALDVLLDLLDFATVEFLAQNHGNAAVAEDFDRWLTAERDVLPPAEAALTAGWTADLIAEAALRRLVGRFRGSHGGFGLDDFQANVRESYVAMSAVRDALAEADSETSEAFFAKLAEANRRAW